MSFKHWIIVVLLIVGLLYVYHNSVANKGSMRGFLGGLGINR